MTFTDLAGLLGSAGFWHWLIALALGFVFIPGGVAQQVVTKIAGVVGAWLSRRMPANQYAVLKGLASDACTAAWQYGEAQDWSNPDRKEYALQQLRDLAAAHHIDPKVFTSPILDTLLETVWAQIKPALAAAGITTNAGTTTGPNVSGAPSAAAMARMAEETPTAILPVLGRGSPVPGLGASARSFLNTNPAAAALPAPVAAATGAASVSGVTPSGLRTVAAASTPRAPIAPDPAPVVTSPSAAEAPDPAPVEAPATEPAPAPESARA